MICLMVMQHIYVHIYVRMYNILNTVIKLSAVSVMVGLHITIRMLFKSILLFSDSIYTLCYTYVSIIYLIIMTAHFGIG